MATVSAWKAELRREVERLDDRMAGRMLDLLRWARAVEAGAVENVDAATRRAIDLGRRQIERGDFVTLDEVRSPHSSRRSPKRRR